MRLRGHPWGEDFIYDERLLTGAARPARCARSGWRASARLQMLAMSFGPARALLAPLRAAQAGRGAERRSSASRAATSWAFPRPRDDAGQGRQAAVDEFIEQLMDSGARRHHHRRRQLAVRGHCAPHEIRREHHGLLYIGTGVSGGEKGARHGPSIMPGGSPAAWPHVKPHLPGHRRQGRRRHALLRLGRAKTAPATT
jgi:hypothetical protein